ncbi:MAG: hypothetical protein WCC27_01110 [Acidobacteriaceae bacterium]
MEPRSKVEELRRRAVVTAALVAILSAGPALSMTHGHRLVGFVCIGAQVVLLVIAISLLVRLKKAKAEEQD